MNVFVFLYHWSTLICTLLIFYKKIDLLRSLYQEFPNSISHALAFYLFCLYLKKKDIVSIFNGVIQLRICNWKCHNRHQLILGISFNKYYKMCRQHFSCRQKSIFFDYVMEKIDLTEKWWLHYYLIKLNWITFWFGIKAGKV